MTPYAATKIQETEIAKRRHVEERHFHLTEDQRTLLDAGPVDVIFSRVFLEFILRDCESARSDKEVMYASEGVVLALKLIGTSTFREVRLSSWEKLGGARGMGSGGMALILDVLKVFGFDLVHDNTAVEPRPTWEKEALQLLKAIGIG